MVVIGFDVDTKRRAYAIWDGKRVLSTGHIEDAGHLLTLAGEYEIDTAYIESPPYVQNLQVVSKLNRAVGKLEGYCESCMLESHLIAVASWKAMAIGTGRADKQQVKDVLTATTDVETGLTQDEYDALGIAIAGHGIERQKIVEGEASGSVG
jgi:Holliday junction resolvasome RuvABC endonuclease subunit